MDKWWALILHFNRHIRGQFFCGTALFLCKKIVRSFAGDLTKVTNCITFWNHCTTNKVTHEIITSCRTLKVNNRETARGMIVPAKMKSEGLIRVNLTR